MQENHYYPFGLNHEGPFQPVQPVENMYQYNGKELNEEFGLNWNDYGARFYDPAVGRWTSIDPLAAKYSPMSPYAYVGNMPTKAIDPDGRKIIITNDVKNTLTSLSKIAVTNQGATRLNSLIGRSASYYTQSIWWTINSGFDPSGEEGNPRTIYFVGTAFRPRLEGGRNKSHYVLAHELDHAYRHGQGLNRRDLEWYASKFGNNQRAIYGETALRNRYSLPPSKGGSIGIGDNLRTANLDQESVSNFTEINDINAGGDRYLGFSYEKSENGGEASTNYILSVRTESGEFAYRKFDNKEEYDSAVERVNKLKDNNEKD